MKTKIKIPNGWRVLRIGTMRKGGDKYFNCGKWIETTLLLSPIVGGLTYIRRKTKKAEL